MPGFIGNQERLIREKWPKGWLWQGSPYIAILPAEPNGQPLIVLPQQRRPEPTVVLVPTRISPAAYLSKQLIVPPTSLRPTLAPVLGRALLSAAVLQTPLTKCLVVSIQPPGKRPTTPSLLSAGVAIVPEPSELLRSPLVIRPQLPPPTPAPTFHAGVMQEALIPPPSTLIIPPPPLVIQSPSIMSGQAHQEIIIPRGQLIVPAQELPKTRPSIFRQFPSIATAEPSTYWILRGWVPDGWVPLPPAVEEPPTGNGNQLVIAALPQRNQTPTALLRSFTPTVPIALSHPSRPLVVPAPQTPETAKPNVLRWHTPPLVATSLPLAQPLIVPPPAQQSQTPTVIRSIVQPSLVVPQGQPLIVPGQPIPPTAQPELGWFTPEAIVPPAGLFVIVIPQIAQEKNQLRASFSTAIRFPTPTIPPINAQLIVRAHPWIAYQQPFAILGGTSLTIPPPGAITLDLGLLATYSDGEFVFSQSSDSTL